MHSSNYEGIQYNTQLTGNKKNKKTKQNKT